MINIQSTKYGITEEIVRPYLAWFALLTLFFIPGIATSLICAEKVNKTIINYYYSPISGLYVVAGKFLSFCTLLLLMIILSSVLPISLMIAGNLDWGQFVVGAAGVYLMLCAAMSFAILVSSFTNSVLRSNIAIFVGLFAFICIEWAAEFTGKLALTLQFYGLLYPLKDLLSGYVTLQSVAYYFFIILLCLLLSSLKYERGAAYD